MLEPGYRGRLPSQLFRFSKKRAQTSRTGPPLPDLIQASPQASPQRLRSPDAEDRTPAPSHALITLSDAKLTIQQAPESHWATPSLQYLPTQQAQPVMFYAIYTCIVIPMKRILLTIPSMCYFLFNDDVKVSQHVCPSLPATYVEAHLMQFKFIITAYLLSSYANNVV